MGGRLSEAEAMSVKSRTKLIREGDYVAEIDIEVVPCDDDVGWAPYLRVADAVLLDSVRGALRRGDVAAATRSARIYRLDPVSTP